jgi:hypothetical protein
MVDPKSTNERTVETEAGLDQAARRVWVKPRLETVVITATEATATPTKNDGGGTSAS